MTQDLIEKEKYKAAEEKHEAAQVSGNPKDYEAAALLFDQCEGRKAEQMARQCRRAARLLEEVDA